MSFNEKKFGTKIRVFALGACPVVIGLGMFDDDAGATSMGLLCVAMVIYGFGSLWAQDFKTRTGLLPLPPFIKPSRSTQSWVKGFQHYLGWVLLVTAPSSSAAYGRGFVLVLLVLVIWYALEFLRYEHPAMVTGDESPI
jgi:uncharacterized membrane protein